MIKQGVILASGLGSRLNSEGRNEPKPLMPVGGMALIERVIKLMYRAGIEKIVVVLGYRSDQMETFFRKKGFSGIVTVINEEYNKKNGISLLKASEKLEKGPFLLSMADHVFEKEYFKKFVSKASSLLENSDVLLSVDTDIEGVFDLDDATKVFTEGSLITKIGKDLKAYNCIDTGLFLCNWKIFDKLDAIYKKEGDVSISEGMKALADDSKFSFVDMTGHLWQDVDTPSMKNEAEERLIDNFIAKEPEFRFFSNVFFQKMCKEIILRLFKKENRDIGVMETLFFVANVLTAVISVKFEIVFPSVITVFFSTVLYFLNKMERNLRLIDESRGFSLFSYGVNLTLAFIPVAMSVNIFVGLTAIILMILTVSSNVTGLFPVFRSQCPKISPLLMSSYMSPSFFAVVYVLSVVLYVPDIIILIASAIFLFIHEINSVESPE